MLFFLFGYKIAFTLNCILSDSHHCTCSSYRIVTVTHNLHTCTLLSLADTLPSSQYKQLYHCRGPSTPTQIDSDLNRAILLAGGHLQFLIVRTVNLYFFESDNSGKHYLNRVPVVHGKTVRFLHLSLPLFGGRLSSVRVLHYHYKTI